MKEPADEIISTPFKLLLAPLAEQSRARSFQTHRVEQPSDSDRTQQSLCCSITFFFFIFSLYGRTCLWHTRKWHVCHDVLLQPPISTSQAESFSLSHSVFTPRHSSPPTSIISNICLFDFTTTCLTSSLSVRTPVNLSSRVFFSICQRKRTGILSFSQTSVTLLLSLTLLIPHQSPSSKQLVCVSSSVSMSRFLGGDTDVFGFFFSFSSTGDVPSSEIRFINGHAV